MPLATQYAADADAGAGTGDENDHGHEFYAGLEGMSSAPCVDVRFRTLLSSRFETGCPALQRRSPA